MKTFTRKGAQIDFREFDRDAELEIEITDDVSQNIYLNFDQVNDLIIYLATQLKKENQVIELFNHINTKAWRS